MRRFLTLGFEYEIAVGQSLEEPQTRPRRGSTKSVMRKSRGLCKPEGQLCLDPAITLQNVRIADHVLRKALRPSTERGGTG